MLFDAKLSADKRNRALVPLAVIEDSSNLSWQAKIEFVNWGADRFTDFFVLYEKDGAWKTSGKVYNSQSNI